MSAALLAEVQYSDHAKHIVPLSKFMDAIHRLRRHAKKPPSEFATRLKGLHPPPLAIGNHGSPPASTSILGDGPTASWIWDSGLTVSVRWTDEIHLGFQSVLAEAGVGVSGGAIFECARQSLTGRSRTRLDSCTGQEMKRCNVRIRRKKRDAERTGECARGSSVTLRSVKQACCDEGGGEMRAIIPAPPDFSSLSLIGEARRTRLTVLSTRQSAALTSPTDRTPARLRCPASSLPEVLTDRF